MGPEIDKIAMGKVGDTSLLDQLSTSQKIGIFEDEISPDLLFEIELQIEQSKAVQAQRCINHAPFIAFPDSTGQWYLVQGCCNNWNCPRCGQIRARAEYGRMVDGARKLVGKGEHLYFVTITCRGKDLDLKTADDDYLLWTNRLLSSWRARTKRQEQTWCYVQVTERQERGAAHSHMITCSVPNDVIPFKKGEMLPSGIVATHDCLYSQWFVNRNVSPGLGRVCDISPVRNPIAVAVYIAKYLFKDAQTTLWPKGWRRIRYSQNWPKLDLKSSGQGFPVLKFSDWVRVANLPLVKAGDAVAYEAALAALCTNVLPPSGNNVDPIDHTEEINAILTDQF